MIRVFLIWLVCLGSGWAQAQWDPKNTWVFTVGILEWKRSDTWASFPKVNRRDARFVESWQRLGVPADHIVYLSDKDATANAIQNALGSVLKQTKPGDTLVVYYAGHGYRDESQRAFYMVPYDGYDVDTLWSMNGLATRLEKEFNGARLLLAADCCHSGSLRWLARRWKGKAALYALSSSTARRPSTGNWTFTDCLLDGLAGDPRCDHNADGWITLGEIASQVERDMAFAEAQRAGGDGSSGAPLDLNWVAATRNARRGEGEYVEVLYDDGKIYKARVLDRGERGVLVRWMGLPEDYPDEWMSARTVRGLKEAVLPPPEPAGNIAW